MMQSTNIHARENFEKVYSKFFVNLPFWVGAGVSAFVAFGYAKLFAICEEWAISHGKDPIILFTAPIALVVSFLIGHYISKEALGSGIPQIMSAIDIKNDRHPFIEKLFSLKMITAKILGSSLCVLGGGSIGREGPTLQISAALFFQISKYWPKSLPKPPQNLMILAGGAGGLAAAFNTPLGGVVFAIEELSKTHINLVRTSIFQAVIIAGLLTQMVLGNYIYLGHPVFDVAAKWVFMQTIFIAIISGLIGAIVAEALYEIGRWRKNRSFKSKLIMTLLCGLALSGVIYFCGPTTVGGGKSFMADMLANPNTGDGSILIPFSRVFGNFFSYIGGVVGGVFAPALASGAAIAQYMTQLFGFGAPRVMMLVGMVAFLTGLTRTPFTSFVLVLEMTDSHEIIVYLMLSSLAASLISRLVNAKSFYEQVAHDILTELEDTKNGSST